MLSAERCECTFRFIVSITETLGIEGYAMQPFLYHKELCIAHYVTVHNDSIARLAGIDDDEKV